MKNIIIYLAFIGISVYAQDCPNCPPPVIPPNCGVPDCSLPENQQNIALFPHPDPNYFWQCAPFNSTVRWAAIARSCACGTVFNPHVFPPRCTFWDERSWTPICNWVRPPVLRPCDPWCPDCDGDEVTPPGNGPIITPRPPPNGPPNGGPQTPVPEPPTPSPPNGCSCPCIPCIWWPCVPCNPCQC